MKVQIAIAILIIIVLHMDPVLGKVVSQRYLNKQTNSRYFKVRELSYILCISAHILGAK